MQWPYISGGKEQNPRRYSANSEDPMTAPYYSQEPIQHCQSYSLFSPYRQTQFGYSPDCSDFQNEAYSCQKMAIIPPAQGTPGTLNRGRILSFSESKKKRGNLADFAVKYKTEVPYSQPT